APPISVPAMGSCYQRRPVHGIPRRAGNEHCAGRPRGIATELMASALARAVVFVSDRDGPALRRREQALVIAGIPHSLESERRPSATYYKLCVDERDAVNAYIALGMAGCKRGPRVRETSEPALTESLSDVAGMLRDEAAIAAEKLVGVMRVVG